MSEIASLEPLEAPSTAVAEPETPPPPTDCPRCKKKLVDPAGMGWCPACGYCRSLDSNVAETAEDRQEATKRQPVTMWQLVRDMPMWLRILLIGVGAIVIGAIVADQRLPSDSRQRAIWGLGAVVLALATIILAHLIAARQVSGNDVRRHARGSYTLGGLWRASIAHLPRTTIPISMLAWGFTILFTGLFVIGGLGWWVTNVKFADGKTRAAQQK